MFLFPILRECTLVKCHCGIFTELANSTTGKRAKRVLGHHANLASVPNLDNASGHKAIKETETPLKTEFNQSKAKTNNNYSKLMASDPQKSKLNISQ